MIIDPNPQGTEGWLKARMGVVTASRFSDVLAKVKSGEAASRRNYRTEIVLSWLGVPPAEPYVSDDMLRGASLEGEAREMYEFKENVSVEQVGFIRHSEIAAGASPDGLVSKNGLIEIKCLNAANHIDALEWKSIAPKYIPQVHGQLWITQRLWCDFIVYNPDFPEHLKMAVWRVKRDHAYIAMLEGAVKDFLEEAIFLHERLLKHDKPWRKT